MALATNAMLVEVNISSWSGRKLDRKVSSEVNVNKGATTGAIRANKNLFAGSDKLENINNYVSKMRQEYYAMTIPWSTSGTRMLPTKQFFIFKEWVTKSQTEYADMVNTFLLEYTTLISAQAFRLGTMFDSNEYPSAGELQSKFRFSHTIMPMPEAGDFRIDAEEELKRELQEQYAKALEERTAGVVGELWDRLYTTVEHLKDKCALEKTIFRESTLENALELCALLTRLNVTNDPELEARRLELEKGLCGVTTEGLRKDEQVRIDTKAKMDALLSKMGRLPL